ncbi:MAG: iron-sulfur cluster assembly scaffold protein [Candidatus Nealsonbacteria bacterium]
MEKPYYSKAIIDRFMHPKNVGKIKNADGVGDTQNLRCGDIMKIYITVGKKDGKEVIKDAKFETMGCGHAVAISDMMCDLIKGKTFAEAIKVGYEDIADEIGPVPPVKVHCAKLAQTAIKGAIEDYKSKK